MRYIKRNLAILLCLCLIAPCAALAEETALALTDTTDYEVVSAPVEAAPAEEEYALQPDAPQEEAAVSAPEEDAQPKGSGVKIDAAHFPDRIFRKYVSDTFDTNHDGYLSKQEREDAFGIYVSSMGITSLKGMEYFPNLYDVFCNNNKLKSLDVGTSILEGLSCFGNPIEKLDISKNEWQRGTIYRGVIEGHLERTVKNGVILYGGMAMTTLEFDAKTVLIIDGVAVDGSSRTLKNIYLKKTGDNGEIALAAGKKYQIIPSFAKIGNGRPKKVTSSNTKVGTIGYGGVLKAVSPGTTTIAVETTTGIIATIKVEVVSADREKVSITNGSKATMRVGDGLRLKAKVWPAGTASKLTWKSSDTKVATVSKNGVVKAKKKGTATITVKTANGQQAKIKVTVKPKPVELSNYLGKDIKAFARKYGLKIKKGVFAQTSWEKGTPILYINSSELRIDAFKGAGGIYRIVNIEILKRGRFLLYGIEPGDSQTSAIKKLKRQFRKGPSTYHNESDTGYTVEVSGSEPDYYWFWAGVYYKNGKVTEVVHIETT